MPTPQTPDIPEPLQTKKRSATSAHPDTKSGVATGLGMGFEFTGAVLGMAAIGYGIDYLTGGGSNWTLIGASVGILGGFYNLYKATQRMNAAASKRARKASGQSAGLVAPRSDTDGEGGVTRAEPWQGRKASRPDRKGMHDLFSAKEIDGSDVDIEFPRDEDDELGIRDS